MKFSYALCALLLGAASCGGNTTAPCTEPLGDTAWKLTEMEAIPAEAIDLQPEAFSFTFDSADTMVYGLAACNRFFGKYEGGTDGVLRFGALGSTRMLGPGEEYEQPFYQMLDAVDRYEVCDGQLIFYGGDQVLATFRAAVPASEAE